MPLANISPLPAGSDPKSVEITVTALLKSVIEAGHAPDDWEVLTKKAMNIHSTIVIAKLNAMKARKTNPKDSR